MTIPFHRRPHLSYHFKRTFVRNLKYNFVHLLWLWLLFFGSPCGATPADSTGQKVIPANLDEDEICCRIRGLEKEPTTPFNQLRELANATLYGPRKVVYALFNSVGYSTRLLKSPKIIEDFDDLYQNMDPKTHKIKWLPFVRTTSYYRPTAQLSVVYMYKNKTSLAWSGKYTGQDKWGLKARLFLRNKWQTVRFSLSLEGRIYQDDDRIYYGLGRRPQQDPRNVFQPDAPANFGLYQQRVNQLEMIWGLKPFANSSLFVTHLYRERHITNRANWEQPLGDVFVLDQLPGTSRTGQQFYNEISLQRDTRAFQGRISPGTRLEGYVGLSTGVDDDPSQFLRAGGDVAFFIPTIKSNRVIIPRLVFDYVTNLEDDAEISFADYPRQPTFRGISNRKIFRTDRYSFVSSLDYKWPLTFHLSGHLFAEYLTVTQELNDIRLRGGPWSIGIGIDVHTIHSELGAFAAAYGSEGIKLFLNIGESTPYSDRTDWR